MSTITCLLLLRLMIATGFSFQTNIRRKQFVIPAVLNIKSITKKRQKIDIIYCPSSLLSAYRPNNDGRHFGTEFAFPKLQNTRKYFSSSLLSTSNNDEKSYSVNNDDITTHDGLSNEFPMNGEVDENNTPDNDSDEIEINNNGVNTLGLESDNGSTPTISPSTEQQEAQASSSILSTGASEIRITTLPGKVDSTVSYPFVDMFRGSASYIANHRNTVIVYHLPGEFIDSADFPELIDDIALTWILGMKIVIVVGCRHQIDMKLQREKIDTDFDHRNLIRVTDEQTLRIVKEEAGYTRFEVERQLARAFRALAVFDNSEINGGNVISGNFYAAQPFGIINGIDYKFTGIMRRVEVEKIRRVHEANDIVVLTTLGFSPSGELYNVNSESLASGVAGALKANKVIFFSLYPVKFTNIQKEKPLLNMRLSEAKNLINLHGVTIHKRGYATIDEKVYDPKEVTEALLKVGWCAAALEKGVQRGHIITPANGSLLQELYTRDGAGTLISRDLYEGIRRATENDVARIYDIINPLVEQGVLTERPKSALEKEIMSYYVYTKDNFIIACGQLKRFEGGFAEIGCLVVTTEYRSKGRGDAMLGFLERLCVQSGAPTVFVLSTQTMDWFCERGFEEVGVESLPLSRRQIYNHSRKSKIYMKKIDDRRLDGEELKWDRIDS